MKEENAYILGTDDLELFRLGIQHQIWASEAHTGWKAAGFTKGQHILDLGCGPGFATKELAFITGVEGKVTAIDRSQHYIDYLNALKKIHKFNVETICADFDQLELEPNSLDGMYCRWALAWVSNPEHVLKRVFDALKPGGHMVIHEYYDWSTHQTQPNFPNLDKAIAACLKSFKEQEGDIDVGRHVPKILSDLGMHIKVTRPMAKLARRTDLAWNWPKSFYEVYFYKLEEIGFLNQGEADYALQDFRKLENIDYATLCCPMLIEVVAVK